MNFKEIKKKLNLLIKYFIPPLAIEARGTVAKLLLYEMKRRSVPNRDEFPFHNAF